tara:strand:+ start:5665 stop:5880 length:216 start_codon:yes stop_codon:yes gene_type:complete
MATKKGNVRKGMRAGARLAYDNVGASKKRAARARVVKRRPGLQAKVTRAKKAGVKARGAVKAARKTHSLFL